MEIIDPANKLEKDYYTEYLRSYSEKKTEDNKKCLRN